MLRSIFYFAVDYHVLFLYFFVVMLLISQPEVFWSFNPQPAAQVNRRSADLFKRHWAAGSVIT